MVVLPMNCACPGNRTGVHFSVLDLTMPVDQARLGLRAMVLGCTAVSPQKLICRESCVGVVSNSLTATWIVLPKWFIARRAVQSALRFRISTQVCPRYWLKRICAVRVWCLIPPFSRIWMLCKNWPEIVNSVLPIAIETTVCGWSRSAPRIRDRSTGCGIGSVSDRAGCFRFNRLLIASRWRRWRVWISRHVMVVDYRLT